MRTGSIIQREVRVPETEQYCQSAHFARRRPDAQTYLDKNHQHFVVSGSLPQEQVATPKVIQEAFQRWLSPPRFELYDLKTDRYE